MSTQSPQAAPSPRRDKPLNRWHRNAGVAAAGVLVYLLATGVPLQFASELELGARHVRAAWVLDWYGLYAPDVVVRSGGVVEVGQRLFFDEQTISTTAPLVGAVSLRDFVVVATGDTLLVINQADDANPESTQPGTPIRRIGSWHGSPYVLTDAGLLTADPQLIGWHSAPKPPGPIDWAATTTLADADAAPYRNRFRLQMLTMERWLQDLHSGRFFGPVGVMIVDLAVVLLLVLAATGLALWWRFRRG